MASYGQDQYAHSVLAHQNGLGFKGLNMHAQPKKQQLVSHRSHHHHTDGGTAQLYDVTPGGQPVGPCKADWERPGRPLPGEACQQGT